MTLHVCAEIQSLAYQANVLHFSDVHTVLSKTLQDSVANSTQPGTYEFVIEEPEFEFGSGEDGVAELLEPRQLLPSDEPRARLVRGTVRPSETRCCGLVLTHITSRSSRKVKFATSLGWHVDTEVSRFTHLSSDRTSATLYLPRPAHGAGLNESKMGSMTMFPP